MDNNTLRQYSTGVVKEQNKVLRNTYLLLSMTLAFSALCAFAAMSAGIGRGASLVMSIASLVIIWKVLPRVANSSKGIGVVFLFTGLMGASLGPTLNHYLALPQGPSIIMQALAGTAIIFLSLSFYVTTTKKDFSFLAGFLMSGLILVIVGAIALMIAGMFGYYMPLASVAISGITALIMSGFILFDTSRIVNGGETNYIMATVSLFINILNLFVSLLNILGFMNDD